MTSEQRAELVGGHADGGEDAAQGALEQIFAAVDGHGHGTPIRMAHDVVATIYPRDSETGTFQRLDCFRSRYGRDSAGHKPARYYKSGDVKCQSEFVWYSDLFDQKFKAGAQIGDRIFLRLPLAERGNAWTELSGCIPAAVFILLDDVGHVNDTSHVTDYHTRFDEMLRSQDFFQSFLGKSRNLSHGCWLTGSLAVGTSLRTSRDALSYSRRKEHANP